MKNISKILGLGILSLAALACTKESPSGPDHTDSPTISIAADVPATKGFIDGSFPTGSQITVYDWLDVASGTDSYHMSNVGVKYSGKNATDWSYTDSNAEYFWVDGTHNFFGWMTHEGTGENSSPINYSSLWSFDQTNKILEVKDFAFTPTKTPVYDFVYSDIVSVPYEKGNTPTPGMVMLNMKHLFTAISFGIKNNTKDEVTINAFQVAKLKNKCDAEINYSGSTVNVTYGDKSKDYSVGTDYWNRLESPYSLAGNSRTDNIFAGADADISYNIIWPQDAADVHFGGRTNEDASGNVTYPPEWMMSISYTMKDRPQTEKRIDFPNVPWEAGKKYHFILQIDPIQTVTIKYIVTDWDNRTVDVPAFN